MSVQVRRRREAAAFLSTFVGAQGELLVDTTNNRVQVHDGATPGGWPAARLADLPSSTSPLALAQGGTGVDAASPAALLAALGVIGRTTVADVAYTAQVGDRTIVYTAVSAARVVTLPAASAYPTGTVLTVFDESGACSASNTITVTRAGTDTINGAATATIATAYGYLALESNGTAKWTIVDSVPVAAGGGGTTAVANGGTGATTASAARGNLGAAASGANGDITGLANLSGIIDSAAGSTRGSLLYRGSSGWSILVPGTSGAVLTSNGSSADPSYQAVSGGAGSSNAAALTGSTLASNVVSSSLASVGTLTGGATGSGFTLALGLSALTGAVPVANGGSGATTASAARGNLGAAASGANADVTSLSGLTTALSISQGGTGVTSGPAAAAALGLVGRTAIGDASATATAASRTIAFTSITAARTLTLPAASSFPTGTPLTVLDESGACSATNTITIAAAGSDKINGAASAVLALAYGYLAMVSNGSNAWTVVDQSTAGMAQQAPGAVAIFGGAINSTPIGGTTPAPVAATTLSATGVVSLPANSLTLAMEAQAPAGTLRGNLTGTQANVVDSLLTAHMDAAFGSAVGGVTYRSSSGWTALAPGSSGFVLTSNGSGVAPSYQASGGSGGSAATRSSVRQTVQAGPASSGAPTFLPATASGLSITSQNISATTPLTIAAASGFGSTGQNDLVYQFTSNPTWSSLTASTTNYLYVNASTGATGSTTLQPIYQYGNAALSTITGQFTFDYAGMVGYLGNGTAAVATPLVFVGEVVTSASAVTSSIAYAYNGYAEVSITTAPPLTQYNSYNTNLGVAGQAYYDFTVTSAVNGYSAGDKAILYTSSSTFTAAMAMSSTRLTAGFISTNSGGGSYSFYTENKSTLALGGGYSPGTGGFILKIIHRRGWGGA